MYKWAKQNGFTIVELLIVIVVIGILASITTVVYNSVQARTAFTKSKTDLAALNKAVERYYSENSAYPVTNEWRGWNQSADSSIIPGLTPNYIAKIPQMPTASDGGNTFLYYSNGSCYKLIRHITPPPGLPDVERTDNSRIDPVRTTWAWGYWSTGCENV